MLELPMPPSANRYWRTFRGRATKSPEARAYIDRVRRACTATPSTGPVSVRLDVHLCRGDLDNRIKVSLDALTGIAWLDDKQVRSIEAHHYATGSKTERLLVRVLPWRPVPELDSVDVATRAAVAMHQRHTDECLAHLTDPGATCVCRPPAVLEPLVGRLVPNVRRPR